MNEFDYIIIGSGPGGYHAAALAASKGCSTLLVERDEIGGTCLNRGCIPTKALCRSAQVALDVASADKYGIIADGQFAVDLRRMVARKEEIVAQLREGVAMATAKCVTVRGNARMVSAHEIEVNGERYTGVRIIIATGSTPATLPIPGADLCVTSDEMLDLTELPESLAVIGGGVIGMEFASIFAAFGVKVTVIEYCKEILPPFDRDIAKRLRSAMKQRGVEFATQAAATSVEKLADGLLRVNYEVKGKAKSTDAAMVLMAVGRRAVVPEGAVEAGISVGRRGIETDEQFMTSQPGVMAIGDCNGRCMLAHAASAQADAVMGCQVDMDVIPSAVFTVPECAMVGLTEEQCADKGLDFRVTKAIFRGNGKALAMDEPDGMLKLIVSNADNTILGCHIVGAHAADLVAEAALAMSQHIPVSAIASTVHAHPTLSEVLLSAALAI